MICFDYAVMMNCEVSAVNDVWITSGYSYIS